MNNETKPSGINCPEGCPLCVELKPHPSDVERITEIAKSVSVSVFEDEEGNTIYNFEPEELLAFSEAILAKRDEEIICPNCHGEGSGEALSPYTQDTFVTAECSRCNGSGVLPASSEIAELKRKLSEFQMSEFHPDWSMLQASQESLREHMAIIKDLERIIAESKEQKPVGYVNKEVIEGNDGVLSSVFNAVAQEESGRFFIPIYASPPIQDGMVAVPVDKKDCLTISMHLDGNSYQQRISKVQLEGHVMGGQHMVREVSAEMFSKMIEASKEK